MAKNNQNSNSVVLEVLNLYKAFNDNEVIKNVSFQLKKDENLAIIGRSGVGKSVLLKCIVNLLIPDTGIIKIKDKEILKLNEDELNLIRQKVGYLFQSSALYDSMTIEENLRFPLERQKPYMLKKEQDDAINEVLSSVDLLKAKYKMPSEISGGMKKRAGLARTLILNPEIILYDEPTTGLDPVTSEEISKLIVNVQKKYRTSSIIISHDMKCVQLTSNRILVLDNGGFIAEGKFEELKQNNNKLIQQFF